MVKLSTGKPTKRACSVECHLKSLATKATIKCQVERLHGNEYRIEYTPTARGRHELVVTVNGQEVAGSPFPVLVSIHPTQLGKPVRVITGLNRPWAVAVNTAGEVFVRHSGGIAVFDKNGKKLRDLDVSQHGISSPCSVAVDNSDGSIYISGDGKIIKLSADFELRATTGQLDHVHGYLSVVGGEVMMACDDGIHVYSKDLKPKRKIGCHGDGPGQFGSVREVSSDEEGNLYVSDFNKHCVHVFSNAGGFLRSFGQDRLGGPQGVCVAGQFVYVADWSKHCVCVFTTEGQYVTSFGQGEVVRELSTVLQECVWMRMDFCMSVIVIIIEFKYFDVHN